MSTVNIIFNLIQLIITLLATMWLIYKIVKSQYKSFIFVLVAFIMLLFINILFLTMAHLMSEIVGQQFISLFQVIALYSLLLFFASFENDVVLKTFGYSTY